MRKLTAAVVAVMAMAGVVVADGIDWYNSAPIVDRFGNDAAMAGGYTIQMYLDGGDNVFSAYGAGDDILIAGAVSTINQADGYFYTTVDPIATPIADGAHVFTRIFDSGMNWYANVDSAYTTIADSTPPAPNAQYDTGGTVAGDWQPIPEPSTLALIGLGVAAIGYRRRK